MGRTRGTIGPNEALCELYKAVLLLDILLPSAGMKTYIQDVCDVPAQPAVSSVKHHSSPALEHALDLVATVWKE